MILTLKNFIFYNKLKMKKMMLLYLLIYTIKFSISNLPEWNLEKSAISLLSGEEN